MSDWYYDMNGQASAPVTKAMLGQMLASGQINRQTQVIRDGIQWTPLENVAELRDICASAPPPVDSAALFNQGEDAYDAQNYATAVELWQQAADMGHDKAQYKLGICFRDGSGVERNETKALEWWRKAAENGYAMAQADLGFFYQVGKGLPQDYTQAAYWFGKAAKQGFEAAQKALDKLKTEGKI